MGKSAASEPEVGSGSQITELLRDWQGGSQEALDRLMPVVLFGPPRHRVEAPGPRTPGRDAGDDGARPRGVRPPGRSARRRLAEPRAFFAIAARMMRRIVVDEARRRKRTKRGSGGSRCSSISRRARGRGGLQIPDVLALDRALADLEAMDPEQGRLVELKFFGGLTVEEIAAVMNTSTRTVKREWSVARAWLYRALHEGVPTLNR